MIINTNQVQLSDSGLTLDTTYISAHTSEISNNSVEAVKIRCQIGFFQTPEKMLASPTNALKIAGFENKEVLIFDYPTSDRNVFYYFDQKIKEYILQLFPNFETDKLVITTQPTE